MIEILVGVSIILMLGALVFPIFNRAQSAARSSECVHTLRSIGLAFRLYAIDSGGMFPAARYREDKWGNKNPTKKAWQFEINPYLEVKGGYFAGINPQAGGRAVFCPVWILHEDSEQTTESRNSGGYGMNPNLWTGGNSWDDRPRVAAIPHPASTVLIGDSDAWHLNVLDESVWAAGTNAMGLYSSGDPLRHGKTANYLFVDGHVKAMNPQEAFDVLSGQAFGDP